MYKLRIALLVLAPSVLWAQQYTISTIAGSGPPEKPVARTLPMLPMGVATDSSNNVYIADSLNSRVWKVSRDGILTAAAGNGHPGYSGDGGPATSAQLRSAQEVTVYSGEGGPATSARLGETLLDVTLDAAGNMYIPDRDNCRVLKVTPDGFIHTIADGQSGSAAPPQDAEDVAVDKAGNVYFASFARRSPEVQL